MAENGEQLAILVSVSGFGHSAKKPFLFRRSEYLRVIHYLHARSNEEQKSRRLIDPIHTFLSLSGESSKIGSGGRLPGQRGTRQWAHDPTTTIVLSPLRPIHARVSLFLFFSTTPRPFFLGERPELSPRRAASLLTIRANKIWNISLMLECTFCAGRGRAWNVSKIHQN